MINRHPLEPLSLEEIQTATTLLKTQKNLNEHYRFVSVMTHEPSQDEILNYKQGENKLDRLAFICVFDSKNNDTFEAIVNLSRKEVKEWKQIPINEPPYGQPPILINEFPKCERIVKADPEWRFAMKKRGLSDDEIEKIQVDPFSAGYFDNEEEKQKRIVRAVCYYREDEKDNGYARPIEGVVAVVDLINEKVIFVVDDGKNTPIPKNKINYDSDSYPNKRKNLKPLDIIQKEGPSFKVDGWQVEWQNWKFRISFTPREGLVLNQMTYQDGDRERPIIYRASVCEMLVPYADPSISHYWKSAFDAGEYGLGKLANQLELGCDCLGNIHYFDVPASDDFGKAFLMKNTICMHEEDAGILWKHYDWRSNVTEVRRARELVISFFATVGNYDYGFYWRLGQEGSLKLEVKLTGIVQTAAIYPNIDYQWGSKLTPELAAPSHQHFFSARLHMMVDGVNNSVSESNVYPIPMGKDNPYGNAFATQEIHFETESEAKREANAKSQRTWKIYNSTFKNAIGLPTAYQLTIPDSTLLLADKGSSIFQRNGFANKHVWVTRYNPEEKYAAGDYPNQHAGGDGLPRYTQQNRNINNTSIVFWATIGLTHVPRSEDFPVMPCSKSGIELSPFRFFDRNPAMDLPKDRNENSVKHNIQQEECCHSMRKSML